MPTYLLPVVINNKYNLFAETKTGTSIRAAKVIVLLTSPQVRIRMVPLKIRTAVKIKIKTEVTKKKREPRIKINTAVTKINTGVKTEVNVTSRRTVMETKSLQRIENIRARPPKIRSISPRIGTRIRKDIEVTKRSIGVIKKNIPALKGKIFSIPIY